MKLTGKKALISGGNSGHGGGAAPHRAAPLDD
jgi:NAD(P)-dependent dehydrogenase (short-subunit alcohol dehydrogenase family)